VVAELVADGNDAVDAAHRLGQAPPDRIAFRVTVKRYNTIADRHGQGLRVEGKILQDYYPHYLPADRHVRPHEAAQDVVPADDADQAPRRVDHRQ
jgi:hypothetical protein